ncbi:MAG TPA: ribosome recycling factor [Longimicrobiales bacterium]
MPSIAEARSQMEKAVEATRREFASVRTGKATPALLDTVRVDAYGSKLPLNQVGTVTAPEPRLLVVQPWDKSLIGEIEKAIAAAGLGLNPSNDGNVIRVPIPALTEERRKEMVKLLHKLAEEGRVAVRHARQEANKDIKRRQQEHELSDDEARRAQEEVQRLTDEYVGRIDKLLEAKEREVMEV